MNDLSCRAPLQSCTLAATIKQWSIVVIFLMPAPTLTHGIDDCSDDAAASSNDRALLQLGSKIFVPQDFAMGETFMVHERRAPRDDGDDYIADVGDTAPLSETGYQSVAKLCCPLQMIAYIRRVIANEGFHICDKGGVSGLAIWFDCPNDNQTFNVLVQKLQEGAEGSCPYLRSGPQCTPRLDSCASFPDAKLPPCGGDVGEKLETTVDDVGEKRKKTADDFGEKRKKIVDDIGEERKKAADIVGEKRKKTFDDDVVEKQKKAADDVGEKLEKTADDNVVEKRKKTAKETTVHYKATVHYVHLEAHGACSIEGPVEHERCHCKDQAETFCRAKCNLDDECKGYAKAPGDGCDIATTSDCDSKCKKLNEGNVGALVFPGRWSTGRSKDHYGGCWKKKKKITEDEEDS